jgi:NADH dehydrogenase
LSSGSGADTSAAERVLIVGGGFAGVTLAQRVERLLPRSTQVVVISDQNHLVFTPMLPEVAGRTVPPFDTVIAGRQLTRHTRWIEGRVHAVDRGERIVHYRRLDGDDASLSYSHLVLACGSVADMSEIPGLASRGHPLKTVLDAVIIGNTIIAAFERAAAAADAATRTRTLTVAVIGGGFSGVEVAGQVASLLQAIHPLYPELHDARPHVTLLHSGHHLIPELHDLSLSSYTLKTLRRHRVEVQLRTRVLSVDDEGIRLESGGHIDAATIICTVGTATHPLIASLHLRLDRGRLPTDAGMRVIGADGLWAIGDCALVPNARGGQPSPATAQFAVQQARQLARNIARDARGEPSLPFDYRPRGQLAAIGAHQAVAVIYGVKVSGFTAWLLWRAVYLAKLPTWRRRVAVALSWTMAIPFAPNVVQLRIPRGRRAVPPASSKSSAPAG